MRISDWSSDVCSSDLAEHDIAVLLFTSGTTGEPKAAVLRHAKLTSYVMSTVEFLGADEEEAALVSVPYYHIAGISAILTSDRSEEHTSELQSLMRISYAVLGLKKKQI